MAEQRDELLETRAELATRHYHAMHYVLFFTVGRTMHAKASRIGEKTRLEVEGFLDELKDMGNETGDWAGTYTMLATWLVPFLD